MLNSAFFLFLSLTAFAQDYTLYQAENSHYQDYSREELMQRLGEDSALLPSYACDGENEWDFFWSALRHNENQDSLRVQLYKSEEKLIYRKGEFFKENGSPARDLSNVFVASVVQALKKIEALPDGQRLLRELERSHYPITIVNGGNSFNPQDNTGRNYHGIYQANALSIFDHGRMSNEDIAFASIGAGGNVNWNPKTEGILPHIALAHEMYHAFDSVRGLLDMRFVIGPKYEQAFVSEYRAVFFENMVRKASNLPYRSHYGQDQTGPGMLDEKGEPIQLPSPCLRN